MKINKVTAAQDDDFVGVLTKNILDKLVLMVVLGILLRRTLHPEGQHSKARVPVVTELGPVIVGLLIGIGDEPDTLDLLVTVLGRRVQP